MRAGRSRPSFLAAKRRESDLERAETNVPGVSLHGGACSSEVTSYARRTFAVQEDVEQSCQLFVFVVASRGHGDPVEAR
jgi:hypothetical protein